MSGHFTRDVGRLDRRDDSAEDQRLHLSAIKTRALNQLGNARLPQIDGRDGPERGAGTCERCPHPGNNRDAPAIAKG
jgi:hypothetical protein